MSRTHVHRIFHHLAASAGKEALAFAGRSFTFGELDRLSRRAAAGLAARGVGRGDAVALFAENAPEVVVALLAHHRLGAIHVPVNTRYRAEEARHVLTDSGAKALLLGPGCEEALAESAAAPPLVVTLPGARFPGAVAWEELLAAGPLEGEPAPEDRDGALLIYTSGTTGKSKGVELSFAAVAGNIGALTSAWRFSASDRLSLALPLFHVHGLAIGVHGTLLHGAAALLHERFEAARIVEDFAAPGATVFMGVPTMYVRLLEHLAAHPEAAAPLARARLFTSGSAPLPAGDFAAFREKTGHAILERYGMSETLFTLSNPYGGERRPGTVGLPVPGCAVRVVDDDGRDVKEGELGELWVKSSGLMTGYRGMPEETARSFRDGWFLTGDMARSAADGYVTIAGRKSVDFIKSGGFKISAREIEEVLLRHPLVRECAVYGVPDRVWGERVAAAVVLRGGAAAPDGLPGELSAFAARHLADFKRPREVRVLPELPRNALGKVQKHLLRAP